MQFYFLKMRYSIEPKDGYIFKQQIWSKPNATKTASMNNSKTAESTCDLIDNTTADKITSVSKKSSKKITFKGVALRK